MSDETSLSGVYVTGWLRRGASGVIGTNKIDAVEVVANLLEDLAATSPTSAAPAVIPALLRERGIRFVDKVALRKLEDAERYLGARRRKDGEKIIDPQRALSFLDAVRGTEPPQMDFEAIEAHLC